MNDIPKPVAHGWSSQAFQTKAQLYAKEMLSLPNDDWRYLLWSTFVLELLARGSLAFVNPILLAEAKDWNNLLYSVGIEPLAKKFIPRSIPISTVFSRLQELVSELTPELESFCNGHMAIRNEELHSGLSATHGIGSSTWLPSYYRSCDVLLNSVGSSLEQFFGEDEASTARAMIDAASDESAKAIAKSINAHQLVWTKKDETERTKLAAQAESWATKHVGHRVFCPACKCDAILEGTAISAPIQSISDGEISETQQYLPSKFECIGCGLKITGFSLINAAGMGDTFTATFTYDAAELYAPEDAYLEYEPDFNEP